MCEKMLLQVRVYLKEKMLQYLYIRLSENTSWQKALSSIEASYDEEYGHFNKCFTSKNIYLKVWTYTKAQLFSGSHIW